MATLTAKDRATLTQLLTNHPDMSGAFTVTDTGFIDDEGTVFTGFLSIDAAAFLAKHGYFRFSIELGDIDNIPYRFLLLNTRHMNDA